MDTRIIYDDTYYKLLAALWSERMQILLDQYHKKLEELGAPTSSRFFKRVKDYHEWSKDALDKGIYYPGLIEDMIIKKFFYAPSEKLKFGICWYVYFGSEKPPIKGTHGRSVGISEDKSHLIVKINIYPWTIKDDILDDTDLWDDVVKKQQLLSSNAKRERNMEWRTLKRDLKIYEIYLTLKKQNKKAAPKAILSSEEFKEIEESYNIPDSIEITVSQIIRHCKEKFKGIDLV